MKGDCKVCFKVEYVTLHLLFEIWYTNPGTFADYLTLNIVVEL